MGRFLRNPPADPAYAKQPLPLAGVFSNYNNAPDCSIYDSDLSLVSRMTQATSGCAWPSAGEIWVDFSSWNYTNGALGGRGAGEFWVKATPCFSADGHQLLRLAPNGGMAARHPERMGDFMANCGVIVGPEGYRQPMSLWFTGANLRQYTRGGFAQTDCLTKGLASAEVASWAGINTAMRGALGYHWEAGLLALIEARDGNCNYRAHLWRHPSAKLSGKPGELDRFLLEARAGANGASYQSIDFSWDANNAVQYAESRFRMRVIPTKSGKIALARFVPNNCAHMAVLTPGSGNSGALETKFTPVACTTSYGIEQGPYYGMRHQIAWDNQWVAAFAPYYYYGSGLAGYVINTDDPARYFRLSYSSSACGVSILPIRASGFAFSLNGTNADGAQGLNLGIVDFGAPGFQPAGALANGDAVQLLPSNGWIDTGYNGANYPCLIPVENWKI